MTHRSDLIGSSRETARAATPSLFARWSERSPDRMAGKVSVPSRWGVAGTGTTTAC
jgi:hypothetical protein